MRVRMFVLCLLGVIAVAQTQTSRSKSPPHSARDTRIHDAAMKILADHEEFRRVQLSVEDRVITLQGKVELASDREWLGLRMKRVTDVSRVNNQLVLDPPAEADEVLLARVKRALEAPHFSAVKFTIHEGLVRLTGEVRSQGDASRAFRIVDATPGVREVQSEIKVMARY